jgi:hypothetical protein
MRASASCADSAKAAATANATPVLMEEFLSPVQSSGNPERRCDGEQDRPPISIAVAAQVWRGL